MFLRPGWTFLLFITTAPVFSQALTSTPKPPADDAATQTAMIPERTLEFKPVNSDSTVTASRATSLPQCDTDGYLFLDMLDPKDFNQHTVVSFKDKESQTYLPSAISDLHDLFIFEFFPSKSIVGFLVRGSKDLPGPPGHGKSPAGIAWSTYHIYIAEFNRDGSYKGSIQLPISYQVSHFAIFPSGEFLVIGYDKINSTVRMLLLSSLGEIERPIDLPSSGTPAAGNAPYGSAEAINAATKMMGTFVFTPYNDDILVWRRNGNDPIWDVNSEGGVREVPIQTPSGFVFVGLVPSNDRWVGHFRAQSTPEDAPFTKETYSYFELRPQDGGISSKLLITGDLPQYLACERDGSYINYKVDKNNKLVLLRSD